jgi:hypothetical protein
MVRAWGLKQFFKMVGGLLGRRPPSLLACCTHQQFIVLLSVLLSLVGLAAEAPIRLLVVFGILVMVVEGCPHYVFS